MRRSLLAGVLAVFFGVAPAMAQTPSMPIGPSIGSGGSGGGSGVSVTAGCASVINPTPGTGTFTIAAVDNPSTRASGNYATTDCGNTIYYNSASDQSPTLPLAATAANGFFFTTCSIQHSQTITASGSDTIGATGSATTYALGTGTAIAPTCVGFQTNGSVWTPTPYGGSGYAPIASPTFTGVVTVPNGTDSLPGLVNTSGASYGWTSCVELNGWCFAMGGANQTSLAIDNENTINLAARSILRWSNSPYNADVSIANIDTFFGRAAPATLQLGFFNTTGATAPTAQTLQVQSSAGGTGATNVNAANWTWIGSLGTGTGTGGSIIAEVAKTGSSGTTQQTAYPLLSLNPGTATGATVQFGDGTNFTTYDSCTALTTGATGVIACTGSAMRFKNPLPPNVTTDISWLRPAAWTYKDQDRFGGGEFVGLYADDVEKMDPRCVTHDPDGQLKDYRDRCVLAHLIAVVQQQQAEIEQLKRAR